MSAAGILQQATHFIRKVPNSFKAKGAPSPKKGNGGGKTKEKASITLGKKTQGFGKSIRSSCRK